MPTRRQLLNGMGALAIGGLTAGSPLLKELIPPAATAGRRPPRNSVLLPACGVNRGPAQLWPDISAATKGLAGFRGYNTPEQGVPATWPGPGAKPIPAAAKLPVISIKPDIGKLLTGALDARLSAFAALVPAGAMVTCWHEGETAGNGLSAGQVLALHQRARRIFKAASPRCRYGQIVSCYTATRASGHYPLGQWMAPGLDFYGLDGYQAAASHTAASVFGTAASQISRALGPVRLAVTECNSVLPASRPDWFRETWSWARAHGCLTYFTFWYGAGTATPYAWLPDDSATISALAEINAASKG